MGHVRHRLAPPALEYVPFWQERHTPPVEYFPAEHPTHASPSIPIPGAHTHPASPVPPGPLESLGQSLHSEAPSGENALHMLGGHLRQTASADQTGLNWPSGHGWHSPPCTTIRPGHGSHWGIPSLAGFPDGHGLHPWLPATSWNVLFGHGWQLSPVTPVENVPGEQGTHWAYVCVSTALNWASTVYSSVTACWHDWLPGYSPAGSAIGWPAYTPPQKALRIVGRNSRKPPARLSWNTCTRVVGPV